MKQKNPNKDNNIWIGADIIGNKRKASPAYRLISTALRETITAPPSEETWALIKGEVPVCNWLQMLLAEKFVIGIVFPARAHLYWI